MDPYGAGIVASRVKGIADITDKAPRLSADLGRQILCWIDSNSKQQYLNYVMTVGEEKLILNSIPVKFKLLFKINDSVN